MILVHANEATAAQRRVYFDLRDATDGLTAETGEAAGQPQISTNGGAWTNTGIGTLTSIGNGRYYADLTQAAVATAGDIIETRYKSAATVETPGDSVQVVAFNPADTVRLGLTALPNAAADAAGGLPISDAGGLDLDAKLANTNEVTAARMAELDAANLPTDVANVKTDTAAILSDTGTDGVALAANSITAAVIADNAIDAGAIAANAITASKIAADAITAAKIASNAIDADALAADAIAEIWAAAMEDLASVPAATASALQALNWLFALARNKITQTATTQSVKKDDASTELASSTISDDGTTFTRGEFS